MSMLKIGPIIVSLLFVILLLEVVIFSPESVGPPEGVKVSEQSVGDQEFLFGNQTLEGIHLVEAKEGKQEWELRAEQAQGDERQETWKLKRVEMVFFGDDGMKFRVVGDQGEIRAEKRNVFVSGNVKTRSSNGYLYLADNVEYDSNGRELRSHGPVSLFGPKERSGEQLQLTGTDMVTYMDSGKISVDHNVKAKQILDENRAADIVSERAEFSAKSRFARFFGNVIIDVDETRITGPDAELIYESGESRVKELTVRGGAKVSDLEKWATADKVTFFFKEKRYLFTGHPLVVQGKDELRGDVIEFFNGGKQVQVKDVKANITPEEVEKQIESTDN